MVVLSKTEVQKRLKKLPGWKAGKSSIYTNFTLSNFSEALAFVVRTGIEAEKADHHPDILMHGWKKVKITLSTHSEGGVTKKDFALADKISKLAGDAK
ncbi:MAG: 4a-hydroxytetrahydrobiopterin dehydratase [Candidatus Mycalebacterium zealandia]|nr:MAG: 4a-hydroxytetrahydrobiopterin dehydratase [Candidatus Mycalebacterium zealandia]